MELRNAFKLRFNRHHTIHQAPPLRPVRICIELLPRERRGKARSKKFFFPGQLEQASDVSFLLFLKDGPRDQREKKGRGNCAETSEQVNE